MHQRCPWSERRWGCCKVVQEDVNKSCVGKRGRGWVAFVAPVGPQLGIQGTGLFSVDLISVAGAGPEKVHNCSTNNCSTL